MSAEPTPFARIVDPLPYENRLERRALEQIDLVVIHCTELPDLAMAREYGERILHASGTGNSGHYYVDRDGSVHVYVRPEWQQATGERTPAEEAMLKATYGVTEQSRLCCQIVVSDEIDGLVVDVVND